MTVKKGKKIGAEGSPGTLGFNYSSEILQEITSVGIGEMKIIPHPDGKGHSIVTRPDKETFTVLTYRLVKDGFLKGVKGQWEVLQQNKNGVFVNGRKL